MYGRKTNSMRKKHNFGNWLNKLKKADAANQQSKSHLPFRLTILFYIVLGLFVVLIGRLGYLQVVNGDAMRKELKSSTTIKVTGSTPRGVIYDANGTALVSNEANPAITFTRGNNMEGKDLYKLANQLNQLIDVPAEDLTTRDKKDYWLADPKQLEEAQKRLSFKEKGLESAEQYAALVHHVTKDEIQFNETEMKAATIFKKMNSAATLNTVYIKSKGVTNEELATIAERSAELPGVSTGTDWQRSYNDSADSSLKSILGTVSTEKQGLPAEDAAKYLKKGYQRNDRVGISYLEKEYESVLQGKKTEYQVSLNQQGNITGQKEIKKGSKGDNLVLTINSDFQKQVGDILRNHYQNLVNNGQAIYSPGAYVVAMDPNNGQVLAMAGYSHQPGSREIQENTLGTISSAFEPGSVVKAGTISAGYEQGVISGNDTMIDQPIKLAGTAVKSSIFNRDSTIPMNTVKALEWSSNSYMMQIVLRMLGVQYVPEMSLPISASSKEMYDKLRNAFAEYGMGVKTGIDLPNEFAGYINKDFGGKYAPGGGNLLDLSFGQYDTYTPMQLAQYASTVANGGTRIAPHVVKGIYGNDVNGNLDKNKVIKTMSGDKLGQVKISAEQMGIIKEGFYQAVHGHDAYTTATDLQDAELDPAAKTGTAETSVTIDGQVVNTINSNLVTYAPHDKPRVAISVMLPNLSVDHDDTNKAIAKDVINAFAQTYGK